MHLESISVGQAREITIGRRTSLTGIFKERVDHAVDVTTAGLAGDTIADVVNHGGPDQAVYVYGRADYDWWATQMEDRDLAPGRFGENLTISGLATSDCAVGDRLLIGDVLLEVTAPRIPCSTFATKLDQSGWVATFRAARRPGIYCRVLAAGTLDAGLPVAHQQFDGDRVGLIELFDDWYENTRDTATLDRFLAAPVAVRVRTSLTERRSALS